MIPSLLRLHFHEAWVFRGEKRIPLPHCVQCGIRVNFPDDAYVGFKHADED
jgi:hypothetical protein